MLNCITYANDLALINLNYKEPYNKKKSSLLITLILKFFLNTHSGYWRITISYLFTYAIIPGEMKPTNSKNPKTGFSFEGYFQRILNIIADNTNNCMSAAIYHV